MRFVRLFALLGLISVILGGIPGTVSAAPFCSGSTCNGKNPQGTNCQNDAYRVYGVAYPVGSFGQVEIWYSPSCNANWGRATGYYGVPSLVWLEQNGTAYPANKLPIGCSGNTCWSAMRNGTPPTRAWARISAYEDKTPWA